MSLNYLLHRHQVSLMKIAAYPPGAERTVHKAFAAAYADRIEALIRPLGGSAARLSRG